MGQRNEKPQKWLLYHLYAGRLLLYGDIEKCLLGRKHAADGGEVRAKEMTEQLSSLSVTEADAEERLTVLEDECRKTEEDMKQIIRYSHVGELTQEGVDAFKSCVG